MLRNTVETVPSQMKPNGFINLGILSDYFALVNLLKVLSGGDRN